jgi:peptidoglycan/LPS O-acetylase OafA/YrhL
MATDGESLRPATFSGDEPIDASYRRVLSGHMPALDGLRGIAILLVLAHNFDPIEGPASLLARLVDHLANPGWIGVQLFFVLSGFLITGGLLDTRAVPNRLSSFFGRRMLRIFPICYATLLVAYVVLPLVSPAHAPDGRNQIWLWTYLSNWAPAGRVFDPFPHFWSLAVEEQFYLVWPFVVYALPHRRFLSVATGLTVLALAIRVAMRAGGVDPGPVYTWTICRMDALTAGAALAAWLRLPGAPATLERHWRTLSVVTAAVAVVGLVVTKGLNRTSLGTQTFGYSALVVVFSYLMLAGLRDQARAVADGRLGTSRLSRVLGVAPLRSIGKYSYAMYIFHLPIRALLSRHLPRATGGAGALATMVGATVVTYLAALLSYHGFEKHFLALKRYLVPGKAPVVPRPAAASEPG